MNPLQYLTVVPSLGASGVIAPVMRAYTVIYSRVKIRTLVVILAFLRFARIPAALLIGFWFLTQLCNVGSVASVRRGGVAHVVHVGGILYGAATMRLLEDLRRLAN